MKNLVLGLLVAILTLALTACPSKPPPSNNASFSLSVINLVLRQGSAGSSKISINRLGGFDKLVALSVQSNLPNGISIDFSPKNAQDSSMLNVAVASNVIAKQYKIFVTGQAAGQSKTVQVILIINKASPPEQGDFSFNMPSSTTIKQNQKASLDIAISKTASFSNSELSFSVLGLPEGVQFNFKHNATKLTSNQLTLLAEENASPGSYSFKVLATAKGITKTQELELIIEAKSSQGTVSMAMPQTSFTANPGELVTIFFTISQTGRFIGKAIEIGILGLPNNMIDALGRSNITNGKTKFELRLRIPNTAQNDKLEFKIIATSLDQSVSENLELVIESNSQDTIRPNIVSVSPQQGESGIKQDAKIVISFSEPMDTSATQAAFEGPISYNCNSPVPQDFQTSVNFSWNLAKTIMTVSPINSLEYSPNSNRKCYAYRLLSTAKDLAGNRMSSARNYTFSSFRTLTTKLFSEKDLDGYINTDGAGQVHSSEGFIDVGDYYRNATLRGFFSFDLNSLAAGTIEILSAEFGAYQSRTFNNPYRDLSTGGADRLIISHTYYGAQELDLSDFNRRLDNSKKRFASTNAVGWRTEAVTSWVQDDFAKQAIRHSKSQYRLWFAKPTDNDGKQDAARFLSANNSNPDFHPYLEITYLAP